MTSRRENYRDLDRWYATTQAQKRRYYARTAGKYPIREWTKKEDAVVLAHAAPDRELSVQLERSVKAIQVRRSRLRQNTVEGWGP